VLITGGTGAVGGHVARWLAAAGTARLVLASRSGPHAAAAAAQAAALAGAGTTTEVISADTADRDQVTGLLTRIAAGGPPLTAVMHTAGLVQATALDDTTVTELAAVTAAKAASAALLDELTAGLDLDQFVLFSSIAATWGSGGQPAYAAANTYLDALAEDRRARGLPATSVAWGPWGGGGMTDPAAARELHRRGLAVMDPQLLVQALASALDHHETLLTIADVSWGQFAVPFTLRRPSPLLAALPEVTQALATTPASGPATGPPATPLAQQLAGLTPAEQDRVLITMVRTEAAAVLGHTSPDHVEPGRAFSDLGFDSLTAVELRNRLATTTGLHLPATLLFDYPAPAVLAAHLRTVMAPGESGAPSSVLTEIDKLESMLSAAEGPDGDAEAITSRLEAVMSTWREVQERRAETSVAQKLESSTDDEVFDFIGKELGIF
jgi:short-subunit dehydrogenase/acyl carrier protein